MSWQEQGRCREFGADLFFSPGRASQRAAAEVCSLCPVQTDCLAYAVSWRSRAEDVDYSVDRPYGVWGGWLFPDTLGKSKRAAPRPVLLAGARVQVGG